MTEAGFSGFSPEAKAAASLRHPNIIPIFECGRADDSLFISSQFIRGATLAERIKSQRPEYRQAARWAAAIAAPWRTLTRRGSSIVM